MVKLVNISILKSLPCATEMHDNSFTFHKFAKLKKREKITLLINMINSQFTITITNFIAAGIIEHFVLIRE